MAEFFNATDLIPRANDSAGTTVSAGPFGLGLEGDFIGFTFNGEHSSNMGITRVSNGNRFNETLLPNFQDKTGSVTGRDGMYYFGSQYGQQSIQIQIAYDYLTEYGIRHLRQVFGDKKPHWLIFDEAPYKKYLVKINQPIQLTYICFMENNQRIYKGEGQIGFVCYSPFARSVHKTLNEYSNANKLEWAETSGMLENLNNYDFFNNNYAQLYNPGDFDADFKLYVPFTNGVINSGSCYIAPQGVEADNYERQVVFSEIAKQGNDTGVYFNSALELIEGVIREINGDNVIYTITGNIYNKYITAGQLFKIPITQGTPDRMYFISSGASNLELTYDYLYY